MKYSSITFQSFSYAYYIQGASPKRVLRDVDIKDVQPKEIICVIGPNGSGKSTLINCLSGRLPLRRDQGDVLVYKSGIPVQNPLLKLAYIPQQPIEGLVPEMSIIENIAFRQTMFSKKIFRKAVTPSLRNKIKGFINDLGLSPLIEKLDNPPETPSGGEQQLFNVISAALSEPDLILADEPTSKLDERNRIRIWRLLFEIALQQDIPIICATHDTEMTDRVADRILRLQEGKVIKAITRHRPGEPRFIGEVRFVGKKQNLPNEFRYLSKDWWRPQPGSLFSKAYKECDNSRQVDH
ncbi:MAG: ATP-binding cassette domain-containing protein [bacterium]